VWTETFTLLGTFYSNISHDLPNKKTGPSFMAPQRALPCRMLRRVSCQWWSL